MLNPSHILARTIGIRTYRGKITTAAASATADHWQILDIDRATPGQAEEDARAAIAALVRQADDSGRGVVYNSILGRFSVSE